MGKIMPSDTTKKKRKQSHPKSHQKHANTTNSSVESRESAWHSFKLGCVAIHPVRRAMFVPNIPFGALGHPVLCVPKTNSPFGEEIVTLYIITSNHGQPLEAEAKLERMLPATRTFLAKHHLAISSPTGPEHTLLNDYSALQLEDGLALPKTSWLKMDASYDVPARLLRPYLSQSGAQYRFGAEACNEVCRFVSDHPTTIRHVPFHYLPDCKAFTPNHQSAIQYRASTHRPDKDNCGYDGLLELLEWFPTGEPTEVE